MFLNGIRALALLVAVALAGAAWSGAGAEEPAQLDGEKLYKERTCIACHGPDAKTPILPFYPKLAGQNELYILQQVRDIKAGVRVNANTPAMAGVLHLVNDEEIQALAKYLSGLSPCP